MFTTALAILFLVLLFFTNPIFVLHLQLLLTILKKRLRQEAFHVKPDEINSLVPIRYLATTLKMESRTQRSKPRPRAKKNPRIRTDFLRTDPIEAKDSKGQG